MAVHVCPICKGKEVKCRACDGKGVIVAPDIHITPAEVKDEWQDWGKWIPPNPLTSPRFQNGHIVTVKYSDLTSVTVSSVGDMFNIVRSVDGSNQ